MNARSFVLAIVISLAPSAAWAQPHGLVFSRDGKSLVVGATDKTVRVVELPSGNVRLRIQFPEIPFAIARSPDGKMIAVGGWGILALFDAADGKQLASAHNPLGALSVNSIAFSPDGKTLLAGGDAGGLALFDAASLKTVRKLDGVKLIINAVAFSPDGKTIVAGGVDKSVRLWSAATGTLARTLEGHTSFVDGVLFFPDGKTLASVDHVGGVRLWDLTAGRELSIAKGEDGWTYHLARSPDGKTLAWPAKDSVRLWDVATRKETAKLDAKTGCVSAISFAPDGKLIVEADYENKVYLIDVAAKSVRTLPGVW
jgi:WD40 repeat protein